LIAAKGESMDKLRLGISACLLGERVRYDGQHKLDAFLRETLGRFVEWVPLCPEVACGLPVPRESMHLERAPDGSLRLITTRTRRDLTETMQAWIERTLPGLEPLDLRGFVFKCRSPSSGMRGVKVYNDKGMPDGSGSGLFAAAFMARFPLLPVEDEGRLHDPVLRENFIERVFVYDRWRACEAQGSVGALVDFHTRHKLILMSHSPVALREMGRIVAGAKGRAAAAVRADYLARLMPALALHATPAKHANVLQHAMGYFKDRLGASEKADLLGLIDACRLGLVPLIAPVSVLRHLVVRFDEPYLKGQLYLDPAPAELMLRNHV
jgi:uncharacterized protein YbgA (DUF1722 family)/uncharacterized protein YbbK (DUF523 family)